MMSSDTVPFYDSLSPIYDATVLEEQTLRYKNLYNKFVELYKAPPSYIVRAPGRVNIIGEHIDYSNFPVFPMAIASDILIAMLVDPEDSSHTIAIENTNPRFERRIIEINTNNTKEPVTIDPTILEWSNYFKAGYLGHTAYISSPPMPSMRLLIDGTVPTGSGLSSSAALVVSSLISAILSASPTTQPTLSKRKVVELAMISERNVGVNCGGMDQAASVFGEKDKAVFVEFAPELKGTTVRFPDEDVAFVIANTLINVDKHDTAPENYNLRVVETTLSAEILARKLALGELKSRVGFGGTLHDVVQKYFEGKSGSMIDHLEELQGVVASVFTEGGEYSRAQLAEMMGMTESELVEKYMTRFPVRAKSFKLLKRTRHVISEVRRVFQFREVLDHPPKESGELYRQLGVFMNASQDSCRDDFECSCPELEQLCQISLKHGAYGVRLTGAGWGGAIVALSTKQEADRIIDGLKKEYYNIKFPRMDEEELRKTVFATQPGSGASVYIVSKRGIQ